MRTFAGIEEQFASYERSEILLQSIPYDGTSTWGKGADKAWDAFLEAAENMEIYDIETDSEVYKHGIHILPQILENESPEKVFEAVYAKSKELIQSGKFLTFFGGEHSISIGIIKAFYEHYKDITIVQFDAHADLRPEYLGSKYNHACALNEPHSIQISCRLGFAVWIAWKSHSSININAFLPSTFIIRKTGWKKCCCNAPIRYILPSIWMCLIHPLCLPPEHLSPEV